MLDIQTTESLPPVRRGGGRPSEERKQIQDALSTLDTQVIRDVESGNKYNALQQRIRQAAQQMGLRVKIVFRKHEDNLEIGDLYFVGINTESDEEKKAVAKNTKGKVEA